LGTLSGAGIQTVVVWACGGSRGPVVDEERMRAVIILPVGGFCFALVL